MTVKDEELLALAAKAAGYKFRGFDASFYEDFICYDPETDCNYQWNPLERNQDAFELMADLMLSIENDSSIEVACDDFGGEYERGVEVWFVRNDARVFSSNSVYGDNKFAAIRLAIVKVAAEIGKAMP